MARIGLHLTLSNGLASNNVISIAIDAQGNKWFGTNGAGISELTGESSGINSINENHVNLYPNPVQNVFNVI